KGGHRRPGQNGGGIDDPKVFEYLLHAPKVLFFERDFESFQAAVSRILVIDYWIRISRSAVFRDPPADIFLFRVKFFLLTGRVEYAEIRRRITSATGRPLPSAYIAGQVKIQKLLCKI